MMRLLCFNLVLDKRLKVRDWQAARCFVRIQVPVRSRGRRDFALEVAISDSQSLSIHAILLEIPALMGTVRLVESLHSVTAKQVVREKQLS